MKPSLVCIILLAIFVTFAPAAPRAPQVPGSPQTISINVDGIALDSLLTLWDRATGMHSTVPPDLAKQPVSVHFTNLPLDEAVRKMFEKEPVDYALVLGQGIIVMGPQNDTAIEPAVVSEEEEAVVVEEPTAVAPPMREKPTLRPPDPEYLWTPFGPVIKPSENRREPFTDPPVQSAPGPLFFYPQVPPTPPAGAPNGPAYNSLFGPVSIYQNGLRN